MKKTVLLLFILFVTLLALSAVPGKSDKPNFEDEPNQTHLDKAIDNKKAKKEKSVETTSKESSDTTRLTISAVGDIMVHAPQLRAQYDDEKNNYDFNDNFKYISQFIEESDLALANLETVLAGKSQEFTSFPRFNTPDALAEALEKAGFQVISTANNHSLDRDKQGLKRTVEVIEEHSMQSIGTRKNTDKDKYIVKEIKGVDIGLSAYTYETPRYNNQRTINGIPMSEGVEKLIDSFNPGELKEDMTEMKKRAELLQDKGADLIIFFMHWGQEYQRYPDEYQKRIAKKLVESGVDVIFGSHPHVIQPVDEIKTDSGNRGIVINSMGNFLSNQRSKYMDSPYTEDGIIFHVNIVHEGDGQVNIEKVSYTPTWVRKFRKDGGLNYNILPLPHALENKEEYNMTSEVDINKAEKAWNNTRAILEEGSYKPLKEK